MEFEMNSIFGFCWFIILLILSFEDKDITIASLSVTVFCAAHFVERAILKAIKENK